MTQDDSDDLWFDYYDFPDELWKPREHDGWTWVQTDPGAPEGYSLFDADGELMGPLYNRFNRVICWSPFLWGEEAYRSTDDIGEYGFEDGAQRRRHFAKIGPALTDWVRRKREVGVDIALLRDTHAYYYETGNGHNPETIAENDYVWRSPGAGQDTPGRIFLSAEEEAVHAYPVDGWQVEPVTGWHCEGYRLRDETGQLRGQVQVRLGVVRAVAAQPKDADDVDPLKHPDRYYGSGGQTCRGQIVLQERLRPMALQFEQDECVEWLQKAIATIRATPNPDRTWPPETLGAKGSPGQQMFPASPRDDWG